MEYETIKAAVAPCGLCCETCFAHVDGAIREYSLKLRERLGNFDGYARRFVAIMENPVFEKYPDFKEMLDVFASENCKGCRSEPCRLFKSCGVRDCHREKQVDFCFQCDEFPCTRTHFDEGLYQAWIRINEIIRKKGIEAYYDVIRQRQRYP